MGAALLNKKKEAIDKLLAAAANDRRVHYLVVFEEGRLAWNGHEDEQEKVASMPLSPPKPSHAVR